MQLLGKSLGAAAALTIATLATQASAAPSPTN